MIAPELDHAIMALAIGTHTPIGSYEEMPLGKVARHLDNYAAYMEKQRRAMESQRQEQG